MACLGAALGTYLCPSNRILHFCSLCVGLDRLRSNLRLCQLCQSPLDWIRGHNHCHFVNMTCGIAKDSAYARMFSTSKSTTIKTKTPLSAYVIWFARDLLSFTFVLTLPEVISKLSQVDLSIAKFATPILAQFFTTPLHLWGLSLVNRPGSTFGEQLKAVFSDGYFSTVAARQMRIIPPYSIGGLLNGWILNLGKSWPPASSSPTP